MSPAFGTSGLRGLVIELTDALIADYVCAFLAVNPDIKTLYIGRDLRPSSPDISDALIRATQEVGIDVVDCGLVPTPSLALAAMDAGAGAVMVTGSHIPADRNGLKFYLPGGEVSKADEAAIVAAYAEKRRPKAEQPGTLALNSDANAIYIDRYRTAFGPQALQGLTIGVYEHSSVARDIMADVIEALGGAVHRFGRSDVFIPVDTEAVDPETRAMLAEICATHGLDAIISTDGDADRPMLTNAAGVVVPGDILGVLTSRVVGAKVICTPVSSNDMVRRLSEFDTVHLTRIGSPFVVAAMEAAIAGGAPGVVGFEANGGYLLGFDAQIEGPLAPLMTRDCLLPIVAPLAAVRAASITVAQLVADLPPCFTAADRVQDIDRAKAKDLLDRLISSGAERDAFFASAGPIASTDLTDGLRVNFEDGCVVHLRPSGNAPEFRIYAQAASPHRAAALAAEFFGHVADVLK